MASLPLHTVPASVQHNITSEMSLVNGRSYEVQNRGAHGIRFYDVSAAAPDWDQGKDVAPGAVFSFTASTDASEGTWVWGIGGPAVLAADDDQ